MMKQSVPIENYIGKSIFYFYLMILLPILTMTFFHDKPMISSLFLLFFICVGVYVLYNYHKQDEKFKSSYSWERVDAEVITKKISLLLFESLHSHIHRFKQKTDSFKINITYKYIYKEKEYISNKYALSYTDDNVDCNYLYTINEANKTMYNITKDKKVKIYVNPDNPEESVIKRGKSSLYSFSYGLIIVYIVVLSTLIYLVLNI